VAALLLVPSTSLAGPVEEVVQVAFHPTDPQRIALRNDFAGTGLFFTDDGGDSWRMLCAAATKPPQLERAPSALGRMAMANDNALLVGIFGGMLRDDGAGCDWQSDDPFLDQWVTDVVNDPTDPDVLYAVTSLGGGVDNGVYRRDASGTWEAIGTHEPILLDRILVADLGGGALRFYVLGARGVWCGDTLCENSQGCCAGAPADAAAADPTCMPANPDAGMCEFGIVNSTPRYLVRISEDMGDTWTEHDFGPTEARGVKLAAVDPSNPDNLVVGVLFNTPGQSTGANPPNDEIMVSTDQGATFTKYAEVALFGGATFAPDGRLWVGGRTNSFVVDSKNALFFAETLDPDQAPTLLTEDVQIRCLEYVPNSDNLFVCQRFEAGYIDADGTGYEQVFAFNEVEEFVSCGSDDVADKCSAPYLEFCTCQHFAGAPICCDNPDALGDICDVCDAPAACPDVAAMACEAGTAGTAATAGAGGTAAGAGGTAATAGAGGTAAGAGGTAATAGAGGTSGAAGTTNTSGAGGMGGSTESAKSDEGCGCRTVGTSHNSGLPALLFATLLFGFLRRRRG
jgi:MYXO-CTERM domain-containing protein